MKNLTTIKNTEDKTFMLDMETVKLIRQVPTGNGQQEGLCVKFYDEEKEITVTDFLMSDVIKSLTNNPTSQSDTPTDTPTDFSKPQNPPAWMEIEPCEGITSPLEFKNVAWMADGEFLNSQENYVWICFIGGNPIQVKGFTRETAGELVDAWRDYRVGKPINHNKDRLTLASKMIQDNHQIIYSDEDKDIYKGAKFSSVIVEDETPKGKEMGDYILKRVAILIGNRPPPVAVIRQRPE